MRPETRKECRRGPFSRWWTVDDFIRRQTNLAVLIWLAAVGLSEANTSGDWRRGHVAGCPPTCYCNSATRVVQCARRGLASLPETIPTATRQVNLNGNKFRSGEIRRTNFTRYPDVTNKVTIRGFECHRFSTAQSNSSEQ